MREKKLIIRKSEERKIKKNPREIIKTLLIEEGKMWKERLVYEKSQKMDKARKK